MQISNIHRTFALESRQPLFIMAKATLSLPFDSLSGKLSKDSHLVLRVRDGRTQVYTVEHPYQGECSERQTTRRATFAQAVSQASVILRDPVQRAEWEQRFAKYTERTTRYPTTYPHPCTTLRGFIISTLTKQPATSQE